jgi:flavodoxin
MKTLIVYYSFTGKTELVASTLARVIGADLRKIEELKERSKFSAFVFGGAAAMFGKKGKIQTPDLDFTGYSRIFVGSPVWCGNPAPAINAFIAMADFTGKTAVPFATMGSKNSGSTVEQMYAALRAKGAVVNSSFSLSTGGRPESGIIAAAESVAKQYLLMKL